MKLAHIEFISNLLKLLGSLDTLNELELEHVRNLDETKTLVAWLSKDEV